MCFDSLFRAHEVFDKCISTDFRVLRKCRSISFADADDDSSRKRKAEDDLLQDEDQQPKKKKRRKEEKKEIEDDDEGEGAASLAAVGVEYGDVDIHCEDVEDKKGEAVDEVVSDDEAVDAAATMHNDSVDSGMVVDRRLFCIL